MAVPPNTDAAFLREVDEELRRDELAKAARRYGIAAIGAVLVALLAFGGWLVWKNHRQQVAGVEGETLTKAYADITGDPAGATKALGGLTDSAAPGVRALARMAQADVLLQKNDLRGAALSYAQIADDQGVGQPLRDLALIRQTAAEFDTLKPDVVVSRLRGLAKPGSAWLGSAGEMVAISYLRMNRRDLAGTIYGQMSKDKDLPASIRQRAVQMAGILGVDAVDQGEEKKPT